jgi:hypothetical protein
MGRLLPGAAAGGIGGEMNRYLLIRDPVNAPDLLRAGSAAYSYHLKAHCYNVVDKLFFPTSCFK